MLGTHVSRGPDDGIVDGKSTEIAIERIDGFGHSEVDHFGNHPPFLLPDQNVGGFEIPVDDSLLVGVFDGTTNSDEKLKSFLNGKLPTGAVIGHGISCDIFHHEIRSPFIGRSRIDHAGDMRMVHSGEGLSFCFEARDHAFGIQSQFEDLQGDLSFDRKALLGEINGPAPAFANLFYKSEGPQLFSDQILRDTRQDANAPHGRLF